MPCYKPDWCTNRCTDASGTIHSCNAKAEILKKDDDLANYFEASFLQLFDTTRFLWSAHEVDKVPV